LGVQKGRLHFSVSRSISGCHVTTVAREDAAGLIQLFETGDKSDVDDRRR